MTTVAIELNDAEIRAVSDRGAVAVEPGYAWLDGEDLRVGLDALHAACLQPRRVYNAYWAELDQTPVQRTGSRPISHADLAYAQLEHIWKACAAQASEAVFVVPGSMQREQLALLLGIANSLAIPVRGLVDSAVASCDRAFPGAKLLHWDVGLHAAAATTLSQEAGIAQEATIGQDRFEALPKLGLASLREAQVAGIARAFVEQARFDPLHDAGGEQALHDRLPEFIAALSDRPGARIELDLGGVTRSAEISRADLARPAGGLLRALRDRAERASDGPIVAAVSHRLADLPGFAEVMEGLERLEIVRLEPDAACRGALARLEQIPRGEAGHKRIYRLGLAGSVEAPSEPTPSTGAAPPPTHVVHAGVAHPLEDGHFLVGSSGFVGSSGLVGSSGVMGSSGPDLVIEALGSQGCTLLKAPDGVAVEARDGTRASLNGAPLEGGSRLRAGDRLLVGEPGVELLLVSVRDRRGA